MIDEVIERTGCSYKEAKEVLTQTEGDILEAIILLEEKENLHEKAKDRFSSVAEEASDKLRHILEKGDVNRITIEKEGKILMDIPVTAGIVGAVLFAPAVLTSVVVALASGHSVKIVKESGEVVDFKDYSDKTFSTVKEKAHEMKEKAYEAKSRMHKAGEKAKCEEDCCDDECCTDEGCDADCCSEKSTDEVE
ncbi:MAG: hypothetical protein AVO33_01230 [delta proteobacterium ML8_F1]|nr:MAG: hypothetical protein AVO33_01230 [delta proteobacterium ML8_F1]